MACSTASRNDMATVPALALAPDHPRSAAVARVPEGATLLLYTDGLVERRGLDLDETTMQAAMLLRDGRQTPVAELAERIMGSMPRHRRDGHARRSRSPRWN